MLPGKKHEAAEAARARAMSERKTVSAAIPAWTEQNAYFSGEKHRVWLRRQLSMFGVPVAFILHNPSTADAVDNDPTARRGVGFANALGASDLIIVNAATGVATDANELAQMEDPIGPMADEALQVAAEFCLSRGGVLIAAWGTPKGKASTRRLMDARFNDILRLNLPCTHCELPPPGTPNTRCTCPPSCAPCRGAIPSLSPDHTMPNQLMRIANTIRKECFNTTRQRVQAVSCLASSLALGMAVGIGSASIVGVTFCMLVVLAMVSGVTGSESPVFGPTCAAVFGLSGYTGLGVAAVVPQAIADALLFLAGIGGGVAAIVWWAVQMGGLVVASRASGNTEGKLERSRSCIQG
ncbi:DUF1643 domain-containing protein [Ralstonia insidiosa]|jgi:hypothetical protein|nr:MULTISPECIES: DUF1643 domain-containing protein [Ralstonia]MCK8653025.1 DUF1643 domain-containing protein [Ralstonia insidiosa]MDE4928635.1 DUF1643 domain-containing protein [Ralstonia insidiosa]UNK03933.1 DUF1643 domain-containing protein [Ralstonia insidiosa]